MAYAPRLDAPAPEAAPQHRAFRWYAAGAGTWFGAWGMNSALFAWLVAGELRAPDEWVGIAQSATMWPSLLFLLVGGATADRVDPRRLLVGLHVLAGLPVLLLAGAVAADRLSIAALVAYAVAFGTVSAFVMPARDTLLSRVAGPDLMHAVTSMTAVQFGAQALGAGLAACARWTGSEPALLVQAALLIAGSLAMRGVPAAAPAPRNGPRLSTWHEIAEGVALVLRAPGLRAPVVLVVAVGLLFIGPYLAVFPVLVVQRYGGGVDQLSIVAMLFPLGTILGSLALRARGGIRRKGRAALGALVVGAVAVGAVGVGLSFTGLVAATFAWGLGGAVFINSSRTLFQQAAPTDQRGRALAVYQLGFVGAAPLGSLWAGFASSLLGPLVTLRLCAFLMLAVVAVVALRTETSRLE